MATSNSKQLSRHAKDETGNVYGKLTVVEFADVQGGVRWICRCECGNTTVVSGANLRAGRIASCGCVTTLKDMTGKRFGRLTVLKLAEIRTEAMWLCRCDCGELTTVAGSELRKGGTKSCGCGRKSQGGGYKTTEYTSWKEMKRRCYNPKYREYYLYGGRGIVICERWRTSFVNFLADMGPKPFPEATIDRVDYNGNYEKSNCRWATKLEQGQNTRKVRLITYNGETLCLREWARRVGITKHTLSVRLERGWPLEKALTTGSTSTSNMLTHDGETLCVAEWARKTGIKEVTLRWRVAQGWTEDRIFAIDDRH